ncbi:MAG: phage tail tape measure protein [Methylophilaceae bacterium]
MANDITLKVGLNAEDAEKGLQEIVEKSSKAAGEAQSKFSDVFKGSFAGNISADFAADVKNVLMQGVSAAVDAGNNFEKALQSVSAVTGVTGAGLDDLGTRAQNLALQFGGSATTQLEAFQTVLSKFGPDLAKTPEALGTVAESVNVLGKAAGLDAKQSVDALSNAMLQFGVDASDPAKLASESGRFINVLAASAKVGAAEIPQVSEAILQAGVAAKGAGLTFEETNAAIQGLAVGGKVGSEAGIALRNVISKLIDGGGEQKKVLASVGLSYQDLGKTLTTSAEEGGGLAAALEQLKGGLDKIQDPAAKAAAAGKLFGAENASAAGILLDQVDNIKLFTEGVTGTNEATVQAAINQDTLAARFDKVKAAVEVGLIKAFQALTPIVKFVFDNFSTIATVLSPIAIGMLAFGANALIASSGLGTFSLSTWAANSATLAWTASLLVNPIFLIAAGVAAAAVGIAALVDAMSVSTEEALENEEAQHKLLETQIKQNKEAQQQEIQTQALVNEFQTLAGKSKLSADEQKRLQEIQAKLDEKYPNLINQTKSYKENLDGVAKIGAATTTELSRLKGENDKLEKAFQTTARNILYAKRDLALGEVQGAVGDLASGFANAIYGARTEEAVRKAKAAFYDLINARKASGDIDQEEWLAAQQAAEKAAGSAVAAINFYKKEAATPPEVPKPDKTIPPPKGDPDAKKKPPKEEDPRLRDIQLLIEAEKFYQEQALETQQDIADAETGGELTAEQKKLLYEQELERLQKILKAKDEQIIYDGKQFKSIQQLAEITISADGKILSGLKAKKDEQDKVREKAAKYYNDIDNQVNKLTTTLAKLNATADKETFKTTLDSLKTFSEELQKSVPEKLSIKYAFTVDEAGYKQQIDTLLADFDKAEQDLKAIRDNGDEKQKADIDKILKANGDKRLEVEKQYANIIERVKIERQTDAEKRRLDISLFDLRVKFEQEREENKGNFTKLEEIENAYLLEKAKLQDEYYRRNNIQFGIQSAVQTAFQKQFNISRLIEERKANEEILAEKRKALASEESDLEKSLADRTISFDEYQQEIAKINQRRIAEGLADEKLGDQLLKDIKTAGDQAFAQLATEQGDKLVLLAQDRVNKQVALDAKAQQAQLDFAKLAGKEGTQEYLDAQKTYDDAAKAAAENDKNVYGFRTSILEEFAGKALGQFAQLAASGKATLADFGKVTVQLAFEVLQKQIPIWVASIFGEEVSKMGLAGLATSAVLTAGLYALFAAAQSAAGFKDGVVQLDGKGTETSDSIPAWLSKGESVITAKATKNNLAELQFMNTTGLSVREFYRNQISTTSVSESGELVAEIQKLRKTTEGLGMQITRKTHVNISGKLTADKDTFIAMIDSEKKKNMRRF